MTDAIDLSNIPLDVDSIAPSDSEAEVSSLCGSELEAEMIWGEGPIAPLRATTAEPEAENGRSKSNGNGSSRAKTPQKRGDPSPLQKSKRLVNIHPMRSAPYLIKPNELPVGVRKQQRWFNDHHFGNKAASTRLEDLMEHMTLNVEWRSNFQKLAEPENKDLQVAFRKGRVQVQNGSNQPKWRRKDDWNDAEEMFTRIDRRARTLLMRSFNSFVDFIEAVEHVVLHFVQWRELPSEIEITDGLSRVLAHPIELATVNENDVRLCIPLSDSAFHRLIVHSVCQFYGVRSRTEANRRFNTKIMVLKSPKKKFSQEQLEKISLCEFIRETRLGRHSSAVEDPLEDLTKSSECSDGYTLMEFPTV
ncbi:hypothetical protein Poli38472_008536 [Pythium oligandrum]|uniref:R3H domain-containing protein n=1 Tax=Pythium oligandrum TaxID=41045 RepID=A0A8K1FEI2_PYTOL|nr:hypothetical protein Poli38472_008536 [Pythium oligandrum]|eukprot:TMW55888.1 hypothetical protein Poli38472_008536 [Pythium oligandrum]